MQIKMVLFSVKVSSQKQDGVVTIARMEDCDINILEFPNYGTSLQLEKIYFNDKNLCGG